MVIYEGPEHSQPTTASWLYDTESLKESSCGSFTKISINLAVVSAKISKSQEWAEVWSPLPILASLVIVYRLVWPGTHGTLFWSALGRQTSLFSAIMEIADSVFSDVPSI